MNMASVRVPLFQAIFDEDGFYYVHKFNCLEQKYNKIDGKYIDYETAKAKADELNGMPENKPIVMDLD